MKKLVSVLLAGLVCSQAAISDDKKTGALPPPGNQAGAEAPRISPEVTRILALPETASPWEILGLPPGASEDEVKEAFRRIAKAIGTVAVMGDDKSPETRAYKRLSAANMDAKRAAQGRASGGRSGWGSGADAESRRYTGSTARPGANESLADWMEKRIAAMMKDSDFLKEVMSDRPAIQAKAFAWMMAPLFYGDAVTSQDEIVKALQVMANRMPNDAAMGNALEGFSETLRDRGIKDPKFFRQLIALAPESLLERRGYLSAMEPFLPQLFTQALQDSSDAAVVRESISEIAKLRGGTNLLKGYFASQNFMDASTTTAENLAALIKDLPARDRKDLVGAMLSKGYAEPQRLQKAAKLVEAAGKMSPELKREVAVIMGSGLPAEAFSRDFVQEFFKTMLSDAALTPEQRELFGDIAAGRGDLTAFRVRYTLPDKPGTYHYPWRSDLEKFRTIREANEFIEKSLAAFAGDFAKNPEWANEFEHQIGLADVLKKRGYDDAPADILNYYLNKIRARGRGNWSQHSSDPQGRSIYTSTLQDLYMGRSLSTWEDRMQFLRILDHEAKTLAEKDRDSVRRAIAHALYEQVLSGDDAKTVAMVREFFPWITEPSYAELLKSKLSDKYVMSAGKDKLVAALTAPRSPLGARLRSSLGGALPDEEILRFLETRLRYQRAPDSVSAIYKEFIEENADKMRDSKFAVKVAEAIHRALPNAVLGQKVRGENANRAIHELQDIATRTRLENGWVPPESEAYRVRNPIAQLSSVKTEAEFLEAWSRLKYLGQFDAHKEQLLSELKRGFFSIFLRDDGAGAAPDYARLFREIPELGDEATLQSVEQKLADLRKERPEYLSEERYKEQIRRHEAYVKASKDPAVRSAAATLPPKPVTPGADPFDRGPATGGAIQERGPAVGAIEEREPDSDPAAQRRGFSAICNKFKKFARGMRPGGGR